MSLDAGSGGRDAARAHAPGVVSPERVVAALCVVVPIVATLWVPSYNKETPKLGGVPFFYWYQMMWVVITAVLMAVAFLAIRRDERARRAARLQGAGR